MWITKAWYDVLSTDQPWTPTELGRYFVDIKTYQGQSLWAHFIRSCLSIFIVTWKSRGASSLFAIAEMRKYGIHAWIHSNRRTLSTRLYIARLFCLHNSFRTCDLCVFFPKQFLTTRSLLICQFGILPICVANGSVAWVSSADNFKRQLQMNIGLSICVHSLNIWQCHISTGRYSSERHSLHLAIIVACIAKLKESVHLIGALSGDTKIPTLPRIWQIVNQAQWS